MNKNLIKGIVIGAGITGILLYMNFKNKSEALKKSYDEQLAALQAENVPQSIAKEFEFAKVGEECTLIGDLKWVLNHLIGYDVFDVEVNLYDPQSRDLFEKYLKGTTKFFDDQMGLRKMYLYDLAKTMANMKEVDIPPRPVKYEYASGLIALGDKGQNVSNLQILINKLNKYANPSTDASMMVTSTYDKATKDAVIKLFEGTSALVDAEKGAISKEFVSNFLIILENVKIN